MPQLQLPDGLLLHYDDEGSGEPVLLLHGFASTARVNWHRPGTSAALVESGCRVVAPDQRGHGRTGGSHDPGAYGSNRLSEDARALIDSLDIDSYCVVGYSMGAAVALQLAASDPRVRRVVAGGIGLRVLREAVDGERIARALEVEDADTIDDDFAKGFRDFADLIRQDRLALAALQRAGLPRVSREEIELIKVPCLLVASPSDELAHDVDELAALMPAATVSRVEGTHLAAVISKEFRRVVAEFVSQ